MSPQTLSFAHRFVPGTGAGRAPCAQGTGPAGRERPPPPRPGRGAGAALLSPRGQVLEHGAPRFFRRLAEGVFDEADLRRRVEDLAAFVGEARRAYDLPAPVALGFSNGANIAAAMLLLKPDVLAGAALVRAMVPLAEPPAADLGGRPVLILSGAMDPIVPAANAATLARQLDGAGARVDHRVLPAGHGLGQGDLAALKEWFGAVR